MITAEQSQRPQSVPIAVPEAGVRQLAAERAHGAFMRDPAERNDGAQLFHLGDGRDEKIAARLDLLRRRLVFRRDATHGVRDAAVDQLEPVIRMRAVVAPREAVFFERLVKQHARIVAGERSARAIGALEAGREADNQQACTKGAEGGDR